MQTKDTDLIFQSAQQLADAASHERKIAAAEKVGRPIKCSSKVLALVVDGADAWTAESGWQARRLNLDTGKTTKLYKGHKGPVTSVAVAHVDGTRFLFTGSWDKTLRVWNADSGDLVHTLEGHTDFVKSLTVIPASPAPLLLSTSSDRTCRLWNLRDVATSAPRCVQIVKGHTRPVECAALAISEAGEVEVWTADSLGAIKAWELIEGTLRFKADVERHETGVLGMAATEDGLWTGELKSAVDTLASMDNTARLRAPDGRLTSLPHAQYVKSVFAVPHTSLVLTGSLDEDVRVWDVGDAAARLHAIVPGHCGEVTGISARWLRRGGGEVGGPGELEVVTSSLDGTVRRWSLQDLLTPRPLVYEPVKADDVGMTEEEERELAELLSDDD